MLRDGYIDQLPQEKDYRVEGFARNACEPQILRTTPGSERRKCHGAYRPRLCPWG
jgi:hypothetical protein